MGRYRKILVAYDGSASGDNALRQAIKLARTEQSWIKVVAVVPPYEGDLELVGVSDIKEAIRGPGEKLLERARAIASEEGASIITNLEQGKPYERIVDVAESENCSLIVMGRRGLGHLERALMGSVTARVIGHTEMDVLVVPKGSEVGWERLLLATDGTQNSDAATERSVELAKSYGGSLKALCVVNITDEFYAQAPEAVDKMVRKAREVLDQTKKKADEAGVSLEGAVKEGEPYKAITDMAAETNATMIITGSNARTALGRLIMGSVTEKVIGYSTCPVLVARTA